MSKELTGLIQKMDFNYKGISNMKELPVDSIFCFYHEFSISATYHSNAIEGNTFTYDETKMLLEKGITTSNRSFREHEEIVGYKKAFDYLLDAFKNKVEITEDFIKKIHFYVEGKESSGEYRTIQNYIGNISKVVFEPCSPKDVPIKMKEYVDNLNKDIKEFSNIDNINWIKLLHTLACHHIEFERIHPFVDGNGRTGRLLLTYEMLLLGLIPINIRYEDSTHYYSAFKAYESKSLYSINSTSKTLKMAKLIAKSLVESSNIWIKTFENYIVD